MASFSHIERSCHQHYSCCWYFLDLQLKREEAGDMRRPPNQQLNLTEVGGGGARVSDVEASSRHLFRLIQYGGIGAVRSGKRVWPQVSR